MKTFAKKALLDIVLCLLLLLVATVIAAIIKIGDESGCITCGVTIGFTYWVMGVLALQPVLWSRELPVKLRVVYWLISVLGGVIIYSIMEFTAISFLTSGKFSTALSIGFVSNIIGELAALWTSILLVRMASRRMAGIQPAAPKTSGTIKQKNSLISAGCWKARLDNPVKRIASIIFFIGAAVLIGLAMLPSPWETRTQESWSASIGNTDKTKIIIRVDKACVGGYLGSFDVFKNEYLIYKFRDILSERKTSFSSQWMVKEQFEDAEDQITIDFQLTQLQEFERALSDRSSICFKGDCVTQLTSNYLEIILKKCGLEVTQYLNKTSWIEWVIDENIRSTDGFWWVILLITFLSLSLSFLYQETIGQLIKWLGRVVNWIRFG